MSINLLVLPIKLPQATNCFLEEVGVGTGRDPIDLIVRTHDTGYFPFAHTHPEWHVECFLYVLLTHLHINFIVTSFDTSSKQRYDSHTEHEKFNKLPDKVPII